MSSTPLVAKGSFLFKPSSSKRKKSSSKEEYDGESFLPFPGEPVECAKQRYESFQKCSEVVDTVFQNLSQLQHRDLVKSLVECLGRCEDPASIARLHCKTDDSDGESGNETDFLHMYKWPSGSLDSLHLRTIALSAGANTLDHGQLFDYLRSRLHKTLTPFVFLLSAADCATMKRLLRSLTLTAREVDSSCPDQPTISTLFDWIYQRYYSTPSSSTANGRESEPRAKSSEKPGTKRKSKGGAGKTTSAASADSGKENLPSTAGQRPVVVILQDFEAFQGPLLDDLITLCHAYLDRVPFRFVLGLCSSSSAESVSAMLPPGLNHLLSITSFRSAPATTSLNTIVEKVFFSAMHPFRLAYPSLALLMTQFISVNHSISSLQQGIKLAMLEHFRSMPLSQLCDTENCTAMIEQVCRRGDMECNILRSLPSMRRFIESQEPQQQLDLLRKNDALKRCALQAMADVHSYHQQLWTSIAAVNALFHSLPEPSIGKQVLDIYCNILKAPLMDSDGFKNAIKCFKVLSRDDIVDRLRECVKQLSSVSGNAALVLSCSQGIDRLEQVIAEPASTADDTPSGKSGEDSTSANAGDDFNSASAAAATPPASSCGMSTADRRHQLQQRLRSFRPSDVRQQEFIASVTSLLDELVVHFRQCLRSPSQLPLSELFYCGAQASNILQQTILASPRLSIQQALLNPQPILQCTCCEESPEAPVVSMPPLAIAYWICTECPRNINLHDWLMSYLSIVKATAVNGADTAGAKKKKKKSSKPEEIDDSVWHSAFIQSVSELQLLGFIKSTRQKTDHVRRLVWGRC